MTVIYLRARQEVKFVAIENKLFCQLSFGSVTFRADVVLRQCDDCSLIATVDPSQHIDLIDLSSLNTDCFIESIPGSSFPRIKRTPLTISDKDIKISPSQKSSELKGKLGLAKLEFQALPQDSDIVSVKMYLTNLIDYKGNTQFCINIPDQGKVVLSAHTEGTISHIAEVSEIPYSDLENIKNLVDSICWLCSFASGRLSAVARMEVLRNEELIYQELTSVDTRLNQGLNKVIYVDYLTQFIEHSYNYYQQIVTVYNLNNLINLGVLAKHTPYTEVKTLLMCNFLEVLRYNYALNVGCPNEVFCHDQISDEFFWVHKLNNKNKPCKAHFEEILKHFFEANNLSNWSSDFKKIRNEIVHTGNITASDDREKIKKYQDLHHFCDRVILALLQWDSVSGHYIPINCPPQKNLPLKEPVFLLDETGYPNPNVILREEIVGQVIVGVNRVKFTR